MADVAVPSHHNSHASVHTVPAVKHSHSDSEDDKDVKSDHDSDNEEEEHDSDIEEEEHEADTTHLPRTKRTSAPLPTDSMISVQLTDPKSTRSSVNRISLPKASMEPSHHAAAEDGDDATPHQRSRSSVEIMHGEGFGDENDTLVENTSVAHLGDDLRPNSAHKRSDSNCASSVYGSEAGDDAQPLQSSSAEGQTAESSARESMFEEADVEGNDLAAELQAEFEHQSTPDRESVVRFSAVTEFEDQYDEEDEEEDDFTSSAIEPEIRIESGEGEYLRRSDSTGSGHDSDNQVDWAELDKTEKSEEKDEISDESTAFLLARLEQENNALAADHRFGLKGPKKQARPPSLQVLKRLCNDPNGITTRYSVLPEPPPMTELEFWAALVKDYAQTAQRLPTLTSNKIKAGVPPPLRGVVWMSMVGARDSALSEQFDQLCLETSPYETIIGKDIGRSFPGVDMFKDPNGEGQQMLGRVLKCFSLYDEEIGYCQGLGFLVGPLLMQMGDKDAFCVLVRLMDNYGLRSCFRPDLSGLHLRIFQFQRLLTQHLPDLAAHLSSLQVEAAYLSQWFLSFFAVTCPLPMLFRIYDVIFAEGASETIMRVAMSLMKKNEEKLMASTEFEEVMQLLLSRSLWDPYAYNADEMVNDFSSFTGMVTHESLQKLEAQFKEASGADTLARFAFFSDATSAASTFLGRLWTASKAKPNLLGPTNGAAKAHAVRRSPSKSSITSTTPSHSEGTDSIATVATDATVISRDSSAADVLSMHSKSGSVPAGFGLSKEDKDLHSQIEDLLTALSNMQRDQSVLAEQLQKEREDRGEDHQVFSELVMKLKADATPSLIAKETTKEDRRQTLPPLLTPLPSLAVLSAQLGDLVERVDSRLQSHRELRRSSMMETKQRLRESLVRSKDQLSVEMSRSTELTRRLDQQEREAAMLRDQLRDARNRIQEGFADRNRLERAIQEYRARARESFAWSDAGSDAQTPILWRTDTDQSRNSIASSDSHSGGHRDSVGNASLNSGKGGLREFKLNRPAASPTTAGPGARTSFHPARGSSLATKAILSTKDHQPATEEDMLVELVNAKTAEAQARQELEEMRSKFDAMRRMLGMPTPNSSSSSPMATPGGGSISVSNPFANGTAAQALNNLGSSLGAYFHRPTASEATVVPAANSAASTPSTEKDLQQATSGVSEAATPSRTNSGGPESDKLSPPASASGGFWAWGKRSISAAAAAKEAAAANANLNKSKESSAAPDPVATASEKPVEKAAEKAAEKAVETAAV